MSVFNEDRKEDIKEALAWGLVGTIFIALLMFLLFISFISL